MKIVHKEEDSSEEDNDDEFALLTKNFKKFLKKVGKSSKFSLSFSNPFRGKNFSKILDFLTKRREFSAMNVNGLDTSNPSM